MDKISKQEAVCKMQEIIDTMSDDIEMAHAEADDVLRDFLNGLGYEELVTLYDAVPKWYA